MLKNSSDLSEEGLKPRLLVLQTRLQLDPTDATAFFERAGIYYTLKQYNLALEDVSAAIALQRRWPEAWVLRAEIFALLKDYDSALVNYDVALKLDSRRAATYWSRARLYQYLALSSSRGRNDLLYRERELRTALNDFSIALRLEPQNRSYLRARARLCKELGEYQLALNDYDSWIEVEPESLPAHAERAETYSRLALNELAIGDYTFLLEREPSCAFYEHRGLLYKATGEARMALLDLAYALQLGPATAQARLSIHQVRADLLRQLGLVKPSLEELKHIAQLEQELFGSNAVTLGKIKQLEQSANGPLTSLETSQYAGPN